MFWFKSKKRTPAVEHEIAGRDMKIEELEHNLRRSEEKNDKMTSAIDAAAESEFRLGDMNWGHQRGECDTAREATKRIMDAWIRDHDQLAARIEELTPPPPSALSLVAKGRLRDSSGKFLPRESK